MRELDKINFHDSNVEHLVFDYLNCKITLVVSVFNDDIDDYTNETIIFHGIKNLYYSDNSFDFQVEEIYSFEIKKEESINVIEIVFLAGSTAPSFIMRFQTDSWDFPAGDSIHGG